MGCVIISQLEGKQDVFADGERIEERPGLKDHGYFLANRAELGLGEIGNVLIGNDYAARIRLQKAHDVPQAHGLTDTASSDDGQRLAGIHMKIDID